jgi:hypothetical protein
MLYPHCSLIRHQKGTREAGTFDIEWSVVVFVYKVDVGLIWENINNVKSNAEILLQTNQGTCL